MKQKFGWALAVRVLLVVLLAACLNPATARAETNTGGKFILSVEAGGKLLVPPEYISYTQGQTVGEALQASRHTFTFSGQMITAINGVSDNYSISDQNGGYDLGTPASQITHFCFRQYTSGIQKPSSGLLELMSVMAQYQEKNSDVQAAAKLQYEKALEKFVGIENTNAVTLSYDLKNAIAIYEAIQNSDPFTVVFTDGEKNYDQKNYPGVSISARNSYGKEWQSSDGTLSLPKDTYTFRIRWNGLEVSFARNIQGQTVIEEALDKTMWLDLNRFRLSGSYGGPSNPYSKFTDEEFDVDPTLWDNRTITVPVLDTISGKVYTYAEYTGECVSDADPTITAIYTMQNENRIQSKATLGFWTLEIGAECVLEKGGKGNTVVYRVSCQRSGRTYLQDYTVHFVRIPTLTGISVVGTDEFTEPVDQAATEKFDPLVTEYTYNVLDSVTSLEITAQPGQADYTVTVNGVAAQGATQVEVPVDAEMFPIQVVLTNGPCKNVYNLNIHPGKGKSVSFLSDKEVSLRVINQNGIELPYTKYTDGGDKQRHYYVLVPGEYTYIATYDDYYHISNTIRFTSSNISQTEITMDRMDDWLENLSIGAGGKETQYMDKLLAASDFDKGNHFYQINCYDSEHYPYIWVQAADTIVKDEENAKVEVIYTQRATDRINHGKEYRKQINPDNFGSVGFPLEYFLLDENPVKNTLTIRLSKTMGGVLHYQDYQVEVNRTLTLADVSVQCDGKEMVLQRKDGGTEFQPTQMEYDVKVSMAAQNLTLSFARYKDSSGYNETPSPYKVLVDGVDVTESGSASIELDGTIDTQVVKIAVENDQAPETTTYTVNVLKSPPVKTSFVCGPDSALLNIREVLSGERLWPENGSYELCEGYSYEYALTQYGYIGKSGVLKVTQNENKELVILDGMDPYWVEGGENEATATIEWQLQPAPESSLANLPSSWPNFRGYDYTGRDNNNAVTSAPIPDLAENGTLYWANKLGDGYDADAVGSPILVDGDIITYAGNQIFRIDTMTGKIKKSGFMDHKSSFSITPPTYWNGMVFVALSDGCVQAFNAETLESLWIYRDPLGGQPNCPITVRNGYLYTGFWKSETSPARFVCLSVTDEDPTKTKEDKCASWFYTAEGGFYWAGAYVGDDFVLVGTDDGTSLCTSQSSSMLLLDAKTGKVMDQWENLDGDIRCSVVYDQQTNGYYFTSKGGSFYTLQVEGGKLVNKKVLKLNNGSDSQPPMSTCSPVVYNNRAYVGVSGSSQFGQYSGHNITVIDVNQWNIVYSVPTQGYPQTSGLLTTAYGDDVYVYFFDNYTPGKLRALRDRVGQGSAELTTVETYRINGVEYKTDTAYALFTPVGEQAQYAICSPIVDEYGTIYFKNDSAYLMAFGSAIESIELGGELKKDTYNVGEVFDPTGLQFIAQYANGESRDLTPYISYSTTPLTMADTKFTVSFDILEYHNVEDEDNPGQMIGGERTTPASVDITLTIKADLLGDANSDGDVDEKDAQWILDYEAKKAGVEVTAVVADVSGDGKVNSDDAVLILQYQEGKITRFPADKSSQQPSQNQTENGPGDPQPDPEP